MSRAPGGIEGDDIKSRPLYQIKIPVSDEIGILVFLFPFRSGLFFW